MAIGSLFKSIIGFTIMLIIYCGYFSNHYKYKECNRLYDNNNYKEASICYAKEIKKSTYKRRDFIARFNYAYSLQLLEKNKEAMYQYELIISNCKDEDIIEPAKKNLQILNDKLAWIKKEELREKRFKKSDLGDYYSDLDETLIWKNPRELKVHINPNDKNKELLKEAFRKWDYALSDVVNFIYTDDSMEAHITAQTDTAETVMEICGIEEVVGCARYEYSQYTFDNPITKKTHESKKFLDRVNVYVSEAYDTHKFNDNEYVGIALHEIGHALGIGSHSQIQGDVMYATTSSYSQRSGEISNRDINTVKRIYGNI